VGERRYLIEQVDDIAVVQLYADGFASLPLRERVLVWHLYLAALAGRDIYYDQRYAHSLEMRAVLEAILGHPAGLDAAVLEEIRRYTKLFWINSGPFNGVTARKFLLRLTPEQLVDAVQRAARAGGSLPLRHGESPAVLAQRLAPMFFDPEFEPMVTNKSPADDADILEASANNLYVDVAMQDLEAFTEQHGLNSRLVARRRDDGRRELIEEVYRVGGRYGAEIGRIIGHLRDAIPHATGEMADALRALIRFYETGQDSDRVAYDIAWVQDQDSPVDTINGFVEVYLDPRGTKGAWEGIVYYVNEEKTRKQRALAAHAQWFEDRMPWDARFRKTRVTGVTARAVEAVIETGDSGPLSPIGINLPNDQTIRERYGSKSVSILNVNEAYEESTPRALRAEFSWTPEEAERARHWGSLTQEVITALHEVIGHGSGRMADDVTAAPHLLLKEQYSSVEEARADLVALYFLPDPKVGELGLVPAEHQDEIVLAEYEYFTRNVLLQLRRIRQGTTIEEDHMRNRQMIVNWLRAHTSAIDVRRRDGKTYFVMTDVHAFREGVGRLLAEVQRIKGEGDYAAARALFETYGVHIDPALRDEVVARVDALGVPSYTAFMMPRLRASRDADGRIVDVEISYPPDFETQMLEFSALSRVEGEPLASDLLESPTPSR
jgi:dipeptidyl-peptidase III